ncbi:MAG TPA: 1-(5-phosphoribosyl)-5-[(5-phosphoribosylamino)methylideneamino]imidazole-4-carboxamide isomerase [Clostridiales bacterium]|nr:1-(5-phosphoribosyl)-5-[(5-phosphoribosylamino)methylideneamino]imidazole-4-carboxamide isomerase [Clostridiales bacterium]
MIIFPAIDIKDNKCVRLTQGRFDDVKIYSDDLVGIAKSWEDAGAEYLHLVNLDGARGNFNINTKSIEKIIKALNIPVQIGGGIRTYERAKELIEIGVSRVILGTIAIENMELTEKIAMDFGENLAISVDAINGKAKTRGWEKETNIDVFEICSYMEIIGIKTLIYTDILKDGMLQGANIEMYEKLQNNTKLNIIASGGVSSIEDIKALNELNVHGAIIGKAFYDNKLRFMEVIKCLQNG